MFRFRWNDCDGRTSLLLSLDYPLVPADLLPVMEEIKPPPPGIHGIDNSISKSLALFMNDPDAPGGKGFVHWIMWNMELVSVLPESITKAPVITFPISAFQGMNNFGRTGYSGPCPRWGRHIAMISKYMGSIDFLPWPPVPGKMSS